MSYRGFHWIQGAILACSSGAMFLLALPAPLHRWGWMLALCAQPFFLIASWRANQWGSFANAIVYTLAVLVGIYNNFGG